MATALIPMAVSGGSAVVGAVGSLVSKLGGSIVGVVDPGKARDTDRENRAELFYQLALKGSITAARVLLGGQTLVYTVKEKSYYAARWPKFAAAMPTLAQQAQVLGGLGVGDAYPLGMHDAATINAEIAAYQQTLEAGLSVPGASLTPQAQAPAPNAFVPTLKPLAIASQSAPQSKMMLYAIIAVVAAAGLFLILKKK